MASDVAVDDIVAQVDSVSFCLSKGLGAPVGSLLCGTKELCERARRLRKRLGGGMRQAGILAAAGVYALTHNVDRLREDHENAQRLASSLVDVGGLTVDLETVATNIVVAHVDKDIDAQKLVRECGRNEPGVLFHAIDKEKIRLVTHLDVNAAEIEMAVHVMKRSLENCTQKPRL